jgi:predicted nucleotidyltransferase
MEIEGSEPLTPLSCRAGRALAGFTQARLAKIAGVSRLTIANFENGARTPIPANLAAIRSALEAAGVALRPEGALIRARADPPENPSRDLIAVIRALRGAAPRLRRLGVRHLSVFGSAARGSAGPGSDIDLLADLDSRRRLDLLDYAGIVAAIQELVALPVDIARRDMLKPHVAAEAARDEINVF